MRSGASRRCSAAPRSSAAIALLAFSFDDAALTQDDGAGRRRVHRGGRRLPRRDRRDDPAGDLDARREGGEDRRVHGADGDRRLHERAAAGLPRRHAAARRGEPAATRRRLHEATPPQRLTAARALDREQKAAMDARPAGAGQSRSGAAGSPDEPAHYFRMMKELALLGLFHIRGRLYAGIALPRGAGPLRSVRAACARR